MRLMLLLPFALLAAPATSAPSFPIDFSGEMCDAQTGTCGPLDLTVFANGTIRETNTGMTGTYNWDGSTKTFTAAFSDFIGTSMRGIKEPGQACVRGTWSTTVPDIYGDFWFCKA